MDHHARLFDPDEKVREDKEETAAVNRLADRTACGGVAEPAAAQALALPLPPRSATTPRKRRGSGPPRSGTALCPRTAAALPDEELLADLLGGARPLERARELLMRCGGLFGLGRASAADLASVAGVGERGARSVVAAAALGARIHAAARPKMPTISRPKDVDDLLRPRIAHEDREHLIVVLLDTKNRVLASPTVSVGTLNQALVHPREVFKPAIAASANAIVLAHNHPSGATAPSGEDVAVTKRVAEVGRTVGIELLDHVVIGDSFASLKEIGKL
jgi:DNA repair protein RadC